MNVQENKNIENKTPENTSNYIKTDATICILATEQWARSTRKKIYQKIIRGCKKPYHQETYYI